MDLSLLVISIWVEVAVTPGTDPSMLDLATQTYRHSDSLHSVEVVSTAEVEEGAEETLASETVAALQTTETHSDLEIDHRPLDGEAYLATTEMIGVPRDARMIVGLIVMIASVSLIVSEEIQQPADSTRVRLRLINKCL
jgi:hypothetical protein